ncbi:MAG: pseudouridine synthase [bacterium]|nr:pseudouridine synthase [bacterium]
MKNTEPGLGKSEMRLNRYIARCGVASRRDADHLIEAGRISVNGRITRDFSTKIKPGIDEVIFDDKILELPKLYYFKCYKPAGYLTTLEDTHNRKTIFDLMQEHGIPAGVVPAGRLDMDSEGLLILSNDGELIYRLTHPGQGVEKVYRVLLNRWPNQVDLEDLVDGIKYEDQISKAVRASRMGPQPKDQENPVSGYWIEMVMVEGRKREIRMMLRTLGYQVLRLVRIKHGPVEIGMLKPGIILPLDDIELGNLLSG